MEERVLQELKALAQSIIDTNNPDWQGLLSDTHLLYERLLILNYLKEEELLEEPENTAVEPETKTLQKTPDHNEPPAPEAQQSAKPEETQTPIETVNEPVIKHIIEPVRQEKVEEEPQKQAPQEPVLPPEVTAEKRPEPTFEPIQPQPKSKASLNDRLAKGGAINIGLNDRIAFVKHLFNGEMGDFNRVLSQLNTFEQFAEAENFIEHMVKPEYDWSQKEEFELRFYDLVRQKFGEE